MSDIAHRKDSDRQAADDRLRIDRWLWCARFFRSRSLAQDAVERGRVLVAGEKVKPSRNLRVGEMLTVRIGDDERTVQVLAMAQRRGGAPEAQQLYAETDESQQRRQQRRELHREQADPALAIIGGRPTKRDRRRLGEFGRSFGPNDS